MTKYTKTRSASEGVQRGATAVEFAVVLPLILMLALGAVDFGRIAQTSIALNSATGNGADYAATHRFTADTRADWEAKIREAIRQDLEHITDFDAASLNITITTSTQPDQSIQVTIESTYPFRTAVDWPALPHETVLRQHIAITQYR